MEDNKVLSIKDIKDYNNSFICKGSYKNLNDVKNPKYGDVCIIYKYIGDNIKYETYVYTEDDWSLISSYIENIDDQKYKSSSISISTPSIYTNSNSKGRSYPDLGSKEIERILRG